jgi:hypothetical protein
MNSFKLKGGFRFGGRNYAIMLFLAGVFFTIYSARFVFLYGNLDTRAGIIALVCYVLGFGSLRRMRRRQERQNRAVQKPFDGDRH